VLACRKSYRIVRKMRLGSELVGRGMAPYLVGPGIRKNVPEL
jgi:hypothetical protein